MNRCGAAIVTAIALGMLGCGDGGGADDAGSRADARGDVDAGDVGDAGGAVDGGDADGGEADGGDADGGGAGDGGTADDAATADAGPLPACAGMECAGFPATIERGCTLGAGGADVNCVAELHQIDCCGTMRAIGMNHGVVGTAFCPAEEACRATYPAAACDPGPITTDTGDTTTDPASISVRCVIPPGASVGTCESYVGGPGGGVGSCGV